MKKIIFTLLALFFIATQAQAASGPCVDFFYGIGCSHCEAVKPFITQLAEDNPTWQINCYEVYQDKDNSALLTDMFGRYNFTRGGVPIVFVGDEYIISDNPIKKNLEEAMQGLSVYSCPTNNKQQHVPQAPPPPSQPKVNNNPELEVFGSLDQAVELDQQPATEDELDQPRGVIAYIVFGLLVIMAAVFIIKNRA